MQSLKHILRMEWRWGEAEDLIVANYIKADIVLSPSPPGTQARQPGNAFIKAKATLAGHVATSGPGLSSKSSSDDSQSRVQWRLGRFHPSSSYRTLSTWLGEWTWRRAAMGFVFEGEDCGDVDNEEEKEGRKFQTFKQTTIKQRKKVRKTKW